MMNWSALTKKQQQMVFATAILAVVQVLILAYFLGWFRPASESKSGSGKEELRSLQAKLEDARILLLRADPIKNDLNQSIEELEKLAIYAPASSDRYAWAYEYVSHCATQSRVEINSLEEVSGTGAGKTTDPAQSYEINVAARCSYNSLLELLERLEKGNPLLRVKEVTIASVVDNPLHHQVTLVLQWPASMKIEKDEP